MAQYIFCLEITPMAVLSDLFNQEYNTQLKEWEISLKQELKIEDLKGKTTKTHLDLGPWPTLMLNAPDPLHLSGGSAWKKAAQTYFSTTQLFNQLEEDLHGGVRVLFLPSEINQKQCQELRNKLRSFDGHEDIELMSLEHTYEGVNRIFHARDIHDQGGHNTQELAMIALGLAESNSSWPTHVGVCVDSHFFKNIAKIRALRLLSLKISQLKGVLAPKIVALNSYREWTLFERYSNMLRNNVQVASGYIGGADITQSSGYEAVFSMEASSSPEHEERSFRMARNTSHILALESMLGVVEDGAYGSYHLENLTQQYAKRAWELMQKMLSLSSSDRASWVESEVSLVREQRRQRIQTRKDILAGINDFPDASEQLLIELNPSKIFRVARDFEELRLRTQKLKDPPQVEILLQGSYSSLINRINFIKNFFEVMGLKVLDPGVQARAENRIVVLCAKDEDYLALAQSCGPLKSRASYVAGKVELLGFESIYQGQNVYSALQSLAQKLGV
jgi:hypothetical protein